MAGHKTRTAIRAASRMTSCRPLPTAIAPRRLRNTVDRIFGRFSPSSWANTAQWFAMRRMAAMPSCILIDAAGLAEWTFILGGLNPRRRRLLRSTKERHSLCYDCRHQGRDPGSDLRLRPYQEGRSLRQASGRASNRQAQAGGHPRTLSFRHAFRWHCFLPGCTSAPLCDGHCATGATPAVQVRHMCSTQSKKKHGLGGATSISPVCTSPTDLLANKPHSHPPSTRLVGSVN